MGKSEGGRPLGRLKGVLEGVTWIDRAEKRQKVACSFEHGNEPSGSVKCREFVD
jgi:hypothetical protein